MADVAVRFDKVSKSYGRIRALREVTFDVPSQSVYGLLGPNGAGKTTLFSVAANFLQSDGGSVEVLGVNVRQISRLQGRFTILPQDALFQQNVPIIEQLTFFRLLDGQSRGKAEEEVKRTLQAVGLGEYMMRRVHALSHGMRKRLGIAQAFLGEPEVILLDEPTSGLDPQNSRQIRDLIRGLQSRATIMISSHNLLEIQELCDHVAILDKGVLKTAGSVKEVTSDSRELDLCLSGALSNEAREQLLAIDGVGDIRTLSENRYSLSLNPERSDGNMDPIISAVLRLILDLGITPRAVREGNTLEEFFLKVTGKAENPAG